MICRIADFNIDIRHKYKYVLDFCKDYQIDDNVDCDFTIDISDEDIENEIKIAIECGGYHREAKSYMETLAVYRKIVAEALKRNAFLMHGVLLEYEGKGYLFTADSGTGKTTHVKLWQQVFGKKVRILNGDKPILRFVNDELYGYGTPWCGKEGYNINASVKLSGVCFIERGEANNIEKLDADGAIARILSQVMIADSSNLGKQLELVDNLLCSVPTYLLKCNMDPEAAQVAYIGMTSESYIRGETDEND